MDARSMSEDRHTEVREHRRESTRTPEAVARRLSRRRWLERLVGLAVPMVLLLVWQLAAYNGWVDRRIYPAPDQIFRTGIELADSGMLWTAFTATARRVLLGWLIGVVGGIAVGVLMGTSRWVRVSLEPTLDALYVVPKLAMLPVFINLFGLDDGPKLALVAVTVFFFVWIATMSAVIEVPSGYLDTGTVFGASRWQKLRHIVGPAVLPPVVTSLRVSAGVAVLVIVAAEYIIGDTGLGYLIFNSRTLFLNDRMYVGIVAVALFGVVFAEVVRMAGRRLVPWAESSRKEERAQ